MNPFESSASVTINPHISSLTWHRPYPFDSLYSNATTLKTRLPGLPARWLSAFNLQLHAVCNLVGSFPAFPSTSLTYFFPRTLDFNPQLTHRSQRACQLSQALCSVVFPTTLAFNSQIEPVFNIFVGSSRYFAQLYFPAINIYA